MKKQERTVVCPNCFGTEYKEVLATATSRNIVHDDTAPASKGAGLSPDKRRDIVKRLCLHCGHELNGRGGRA